MSERILKYLPSFFREIVDFDELGQTEEVELQRMDAAIQQLFDDQYVLTSGSDAIRRREQMLGIQADPMTETLDFRRKRIVNRYSTKPPFTIQWLQQQLDALVGQGMTIVSVDVPNFILTITANIENASVFREVQHTVQIVKPANMTYQQNTSLEAVIGIDETISMLGISWNYKLNGAWQLGAKPFATLGPEVPVT